MNNERTPRTVTVFAHMSFVAVLYLIITIVISASVTAYLAVLTIDTALFVFGEYRRRTKHKNRKQSNGGDLFYPTWHDVPVPDTDPGYIETTR